MKTAVLISTVIGLAACLLLTGCASIISGRHADVAIDSYPSSAHVTVHDNNGRAVASLTTPGVVSLKRNRRWFLPARYTATIESPGFQTAQVPIRSTVNPWILGNILIGGVPGLIVDNATGAAWQPKRSEIHSQLMPLDPPGPGPLFSENQAPMQDSAQSPQYVAEQSSALPPQGNPQSASGTRATY